MKTHLISKNKYTWPQLLLLLIGIIFLIVFIWFRFLRERLPKDIPFHLTEYGCIILSYICCIYLFIITILITEFKTKNDKLGSIMEYIYKPVKTLDEAIKNISLININYKKLLLFMSNSLTKTYIKRIYYLFNIWPRILLVTILCLDIFYFHKLAYIYNIVFVGIMILAGKYLIYSLKYAKEQSILLLEPKIERVMTDYQENPDNDDWNFLPLRDFIDTQTNSIFLNNHKFHCNPLPNILYTKKIIEEKGDIKKARLEYISMLNNLINLSVHIEWFTFYNSYDDNIKYMKIAIFSTYLICWSYILIVSLPFLPLDSFQWLWIIQDAQEPFSLTSTYVHENL